MQVLGPAQSALRLGVFFQILLHLQRHQPTKKTDYPTFLKKETNSINHIEHI